MKRERWYVAHRKKVLIVESENLLAAGVRSLLAERSELDVTSTDIDRLACVVQPSSSRPDVLIVDEAQLLANLSAVIRVASHYPWLRLIVVRAQDNEVQVVDRQIVEVRHIDEFFDLL